jgi:hypothetical protein
MIQQAATALSCSLCRKHHRKCDKMQPECSYCVLNRKQCVYPKRQTRKKNKQIIFHTVLNQELESGKIVFSTETINDDQRIALPSHTETELVRKTNAHVHHDISVHNMEFFIPMIDRKRAIDIMLYIRDKFNTRVQGEQPPSVGEVALVFSIQGMIFVHDIHIF